MCKKEKKAIYAMREGERVAVIRPDDPQLALAETAAIQSDLQQGEITETEARARFERIPTLQPYTFVGFLTTSGGIADEAGNVLEHMPSPGDSFISEQSLHDSEPWR
jgi:hypothetical protein